MRGSPTVHLALLLAFFIALAVPLIGLTSGKAAVAVEPTSVTINEVPIRLTLRCSQVPSAIKLMHGSRDLLKEVSPVESRYETACALPLPKEGIELTLDATWPEGATNTALTLTLEPDERDALSQTFWSDGATLSEVIVCQWRVQP